MFGDGTPFFLVFGCPNLQTKNGPARQIKSLLSSYVMDVQMMGFNTQMMGFNT